MVLSFGQQSGLFSHSEEFNQGLGRERHGAATFTVSLDGTGDFSDIQEAIDALPSTGGEVFIKEGTYLVKNTITLEAQDSIRGTGIGTIIKPEDATVDPLITGKGNFRVRDLQIHGLWMIGVGVYNNTAGSDSMGVVENCQIQSFGDGAAIVGIGIDIDNQYVQMRIINNYFRDIFGTAIITDGYYSVITGNRCESCDSDITLNASSNDNIVIANIFNNAPTDNGTSNIIQHNTA